MKFIKWIFFLCIVVLLLFAGLFFCLILLYAPLLILIDSDDFSATGNIGLYYLVSIGNIVWMFAISALNNLQLDNTINSDDHFGEHKMGHGIRMFVGLIPTRVLIYATYIVILVLAHLNNLGVITITSPEILLIVNLNQYSIVIFIAIERLISGIKNESKKENLKKRYTYTIAFFKKLWFVFND